jgi:signal transduction histidine kinase
VQETIGNAIKHGKSRNIMVECTSMEGISILRITNDGTAFQKSQPRGQGMGLHLFQYRARLPGAKIKVEKAGDDVNPDSGECRVTCALGEFSKAIKVVKS